MEELIVVLAIAAVGFAAPGGYSYSPPSSGAGSELSGSYLPASGDSSSGGGGVSFFPSVSFSESESALSVNEISGSYLPGQTGLDLDGDGGSLLGHGSGFGFRADNGGQDEVYYFGDSSSQATRLKINIGPGRSSKRVIFVKSPDAGVVIPEIVASSAPSQEKTIVYVLSKQQQPAGSITIPSSLIHNAAKSKPEVYHIKYTNQQDAEQAVADSLSGHAQASNISPQNSKESFVKTLSSGHVGGISGSIIGSGSLGGSSGHLSGLGGGGVFGGTKGSGHLGLGGRYGKPGLSGPY